MVGRPTNHSSRSTRGATPPVLVSTKASPRRSSPARWSRSTTTRVHSSSVPRRTSAIALLQELPHRGLRLLRCHRECEPVARVVDGLVPGEVLPEVQVLLGVAGGLRELALEVLDDRVDLRVELRR